MPTDGKAHVDLDCARHQIKGASVRYGVDGTFFRCQIGPLGETDVATLERAVHAGVSVRLVFPQSDMLISHVDIESKADGHIALAGRIASARRPIEGE
jgi:hypothetical protein